MVRGTDEDIAFVPGVAHHQKEQVREPFTVSIKNVRAHSKKHGQAQAPTAKLALFDSTPDRDEDYGPRLRWPGVNGK